MSRQTKLRPLTPDERYKTVLEYWWTVYDPETMKPILSLPWSDGWVPGASMDEQAERSLARALCKGFTVSGQVRMAVIDVEEESEEIRREVIALAKKGGGKKGGGKGKRGC